MKQVWAVARKELGAYFGSPLALIFVGAFLIATLFVFFWAEPFFTRNIADVRPLFQWMPVLLLFLVAALTMRQWSEEQRSGTLEVLLTLPVNRIQLVLGKFLAVMALVALSLALTLFLPITVSILGRLDWGPVVGGYLAALLLAGAYAAIGLFVSSRTDNQIVSLIATAFGGGLFYLVGSAAITGLAGAGLADVLRAIGTGSRFESIQRGVIDLRDLVYYLSLAAVFLALNVLSLDAKRWSRGAHTAAYRRQAILSVGLIVANLVALNGWLYPLGGLRADLTKDRTYSLSPTTKALISSLQEPLLIRGYFSAKTHPLLAPLVPTIRDMLQEYQAASRGKIRVEIVDPQTNPDLEAEANQVYGIQPTPFRVTGRYESSVINSYFDLLIRYGDQHEVLTFQDLIEVDQGANNQVDVRLRNLEYDLTRAIKKTVYGFQSLDAAFASLQEPMKLTFFVTPNTLPSDLQQVPQTVDKVAQALVQQSGGKLTYETIDPDAAGAKVNRQTLINSYGLEPIAAGLFSPDSYYLHLLVQSGSNSQVIYPTGGDLTEANIRSDLEAAIKRSAPGFLKTVGLWLPQLGPVQDQFGNTSQPISSWNQLQQQLSQNYTVKTVDLTTGRVPGDIDVLVLVAPQGLTDKALFAVDQYLMRGGAVVVAGSGYALSQAQYGGISLDQLQGTLVDLLKSYGVEVGSAMVLDPQNEPFPVQAPRTVGGVQVTEIQQVPYPYFVDIRTDGMAQGSPITANLPAVTLQWASPLTVTNPTTGTNQTTVLLKSTAKSWASAAPDVTPDTTKYPEYGFPVEGKPQSQTLAVSILGAFPSYFKGKQSPLTPAAGASVTQTVTGTLGTVEASPNTARLVVIASSEFVDDALLQLSQSISGDRYLYNLQLVQNAVDWSVEDQDLLSIRSRGTYARLLKPLTQGQETLWEGLNYGVALLALAAIAVVWTARRRREQPMALVDEEG